MIQRGGEVVLQMLSNVKQATIAPLIKNTLTPGTLIYTDEYRIYARLVEWGYGHWAGQSRTRGVRSGRGWGWVLRSPCQHDGRLLVIVTLLVATTSRDFSR